MMPSGIGKQWAAPVFEGSLEAIGNTPMIEVKNIDTGPCRLFIKNETVNPTGSIKDRIGKSMIEAAEADGSLRPGGHIVEATAGNTGLALAFVAGLKGYRLTIFVPDKMAPEKIAHLRAMGAAVKLTRSDVLRGHPDYYQDAAARFAKEEGAFYINQFGNSSNPAAHRDTTGPEILAQLEGDVDAVVVGVGSGGTVTGLQQFFSAHHPATEIVVADPEGSVIAPYIRDGALPDDIGAWLVEGIGEDFLPPVMSLQGIKTAYAIPDAESFAAARLLLEQEGLLGGSSSGTLLAGALRYCREQTEPKRVVTFLCDTGNKYLSKQYSDIWMQDRGFIAVPRSGTVADAVSRRQDRHLVISARAGESLVGAVTRMREGNVPGMPVLGDDDCLLGVIDEGIIMQAYAAGEQGAMLRDLPLAEDAVIDWDADITALEKLLDRYAGIAVTQNGDLAGFVTRADYIQCLKKLS